MNLIENINTVNVQSRAEATITRMEVKEAISVESVTKVNADILYKLNASIYFKTAR